MLNVKLPRIVFQQCLLVLGLGMLTITSCTDETTTPPGEKVVLNTQRLDRSFASIDTNNITGGLVGLKAEYPGFIDFYLDTLMGLGINGNYTPENPAISKGMHSFLTHKDYRGLLDTVAKHFPDTKAIDEKLGKGFQFMHQYYPDHKAPHVIYLVTWLNNYGAFTYDTTLGIGLDMFLGASYPYYKSVGIPDYMAVQLEADYIPVAAFRAVYQDQHPFVAEGKTLLDMMIQRGKEAYFISKVLPFVPEHTRLGYTEKELEWAASHEADVYNFFIKQDFLYERNWQKILRYVNEAQSSTGMTDESPGNIGTWLGLQIVKAYMNAHTDINMQALLQNNIDAQRFLQESRYKPK